MIKEGALKQWGWNFSRPTICSWKYRKRHLTFKKDRGKKSNKKGFVMKFNRNYYKTVRIKYRIIHLQTMKSHWNICLENYNPIKSNAIKEIFFISLISLKILSYSFLGIAFWGISLSRDTVVIVSWIYTYLQIHQVVDTENTSFLHINHTLTKRLTKQLQI